MHQNVIAVFMIIYVEKKSERTLGREFFSYYITNIEIHNLCSTAWIFWHISTKNRISNYG